MEGVLGLEHSSLLYAGWNYTINAVGALYGFLASWIRSSFSQTIQFWKATIPELWTYRAKSLRLPEDADRLTISHGKYRIPYTYLFHHMQDESTAVLMHSMFTPLHLELHFPSHTSLVSFFCVQHFLFFIRASQSKHAIFPSHLSYRNNIKNVCRLILATATVRPRLH